MSLTKADLKNDVDKTTVLEIIKNLFDDKSESYTTQLHSHLTQLAESTDNKLNGHQAYFWKHNDHVVGFAIVYYWHVIPKPSKSVRMYWQLANFHVLKEMRGQKYGEQFMNALMKEAKMQSVEKIMVFAGGEYGDFMKKYGFVQQDSLMIKKRN